MSSNKTVSILGCGWLGWPLAKALLHQGYQVNGSTTSFAKLSALKADNIDAYLIDLSDEINDKLKSFFRTDVLVLNIPPGRRDPDVLEAYPNRITRALQIAFEQGCSNCILISSTGVYESKLTSNGLPFPTYDEDAPNGSGASAQALISAEAQLKSIFGKSGSVLRFGGLVGGDRKAGRFLAGKKNLSNGLAPVNMIHRDDCIQIISSIINQNQWGYKLNAVADQHPSRSSFYQSQAIKYGFEAPTFNKTDASLGKVVSNGLLKKVLGYSLQHPDPMMF